MNDNCPCEAVKALQKAVSRHDERLAEGDTALALIGQSLETLRQSIEAMAKDLRELKEKPARRAEGLADAAAKYIITALLALIAARYCG